VGKWHQVDTEDDVEFFKDGTLVWGIFSGKYSFPESSRMKIEIWGMGGTFRVSLSGDTLTLVGESGLSKDEVYTLRRVK